MVKGRIRTGPKRPKCAFFFYASDRRPSLRAEQPGLSAMETSRILGEEWNRLDDDEKTPYQEMAQKDKERYSEEKGEIPQY